MNVPTMKEIIRAMSIEEYARHVNLDSERAEIMRNTLLDLERQGKLYQDDNGGWHPTNK